MSKDETRYFWNKTGECFAGQVVGTDITDHFSDDITDKGKVKEGSRLEEFIELGHISDTKPESYEAAEDAELNKLRETVESQKVEIADLERDAENVPKNVTAARKEVKDLKSELVEKDLEIEELQRQIEELTAPKKGGK